MGASTVFRYPRLQLQLGQGDPYGGVNCTAYSAAMAGDVDSLGKQVFTGRQVRAASSEPIPDPASPGLNLQQADAALLRLSGGKINLDVHGLGSDVGPLHSGLAAGKWAELAIQRSVLVDAGLGGSSDFRGGHAILEGKDPVRGVVYADPLVGHFIYTTQDLLDRAMAALVHAAGGGAGVGQGYFALTRDVYDAPATSLTYSAVFTRGQFFVYHTVGSTITDRYVHDGFSKAVTSAPCSAPHVYRWPKGGDRKLVTVLTGALAGKLVEPGSTNVTLEVHRK